MLQIRGQLLSIAAASLATASAAGRCSLVVASCYQSLTSTRAAPCCYRAAASCPPVIFHS
ncbi:hypothetical protein BVRB_8g185340 [Beta vulgaris subsp. vulgaris]|nr:hypothetical protein BVRB_8g185340 [Beta vulgaris subsp. vulgaris]